ncbi:MAG: hypothetical protein HFJ06_02695 [Lachnospiraceae bacterium]|nr:hypothetical protein [Lachnospiraceae bacterium]
MEKRKLYENQEVLVICGFRHLNAQAKRLIRAGGQREHIAHKSSVFSGETSVFIYLDQICDVWEKRVIFYGHTVLRLVWANDTLNKDNKAKWAEDENYAFYDWQMEYCKLFKNNQLYVD